MSHKLPFPAFQRYQITSTSTKFPLARYQHHILGVYVNVVIDWNLLPRLSMRWQQSVLLLIFCWQHQSCPDAAASPHPAPQMKPSFAFYCLTPIWSFSPVDSRYDVKSVHQQRAWRVNSWGGKAAVITYIRAKTNNLPLHRWLPLKTCERFSLSCILASVPKAVRH